MPAHLNLRNSEVLHEPPQRAFNAPPPPEIHQMHSSIQKTASARHAPADAMLLPFRPMFDEPSESPQERAVDPAQLAADKADEFRVLAEVCAVFEGPRKFDAAINPRVEDTFARDIQKRIAKLEKSKDAGSPILPPESAAEAKALLALPKTNELSTSDYHIHRRPGEVMILRWLEGEQVE